MRLDDLVCAIEIELDSDGLIPDTTTRTELLSAANFVLSTCVKGPSVQSGIVGQIGTYTLSCYYVINVQ